MTLDELIATLVELRTDLSGHTVVLFDCNECGFRELGDIAVGNGDDTGEIWIEEG